MEKTFMAIDQYGTTYHNLGPYPRKALLERFYRKSAHKMYIEPDGAHIGYVIAGHWLTLYEVRPYRGKTFREG